MTANRLDLQEIRQRLEQERDTLQDKIDNLPTTIEQDESDTPGYSNHMADEATSVFEQEKGLALQLRLRSALDDVTLALRKMDDGTYGICERCGEQIDPERLRANPTARFCLKDQMHIEIHHQR